MTFDDLNLSRPLLNALEDLGYKTPTVIQQKVFSVVMSGQDVCGIAQTGTGKTFAYLLPCLRQFKFSKERFPQLLILVPTRELVVQVVDAVKQLTPYMSVEIAGFYGGVNMNPQMETASGKLDVVVATPGRLVDIVLSGTLKLKAIKRIVIDEMDEMLNLGFRPQVERILDLLPVRRQNLLFSATITEDVEKLIQTHFNAPATVEAAPAGTPLKNISQSAYDVPNFYTKVNLLELLLAKDSSMNKVLVFVATKEMANDLYEQLETKFPEQAGVIHSNKAQNHRFNTVNKFKDGSYRFIIATDIIARGLDIAEVSHVISFDTPEVPESYMHRIGRTGRADKEGHSILFTKPQEKENKDNIEELMNYQIPVLPLPEELVISDVLTEDEKPQVKMKNFLIKLPSREEAGPAFHEKSAKNKKVNVKIRHADKMKLKYGKPKTRGAKPKRKR
ncbi:DEAD/DEAH box helicase [Chitinophaga pinensis]|uniref:DEAD/DEAH box helicase domain protein n=1 Tax=Chitinophaga pinensis (strain ATCC 43595 / DSM 2588 / LMG 13176 / NBRC 15968 / NCIMB 11800 / UQM 2034) TaxID=485918 RepID=A0A979G366_CHIPD|nr:DEAD/DEAH box helicase [Chitinophaga pinensis]ACU60087.1 DEAD/DEAH box helicase domain protein [Chitinophaga pinensis DSM 2588]